MDKLNFKCVKCGSKADKIVALRIETVTLKEELIKENGFPDCEIEEQPCHGTPSVHYCTKCYDKINFGDDDLKLVFNR